MPVHRECTTKNNKRKCYYQWGQSGKKYWYTPGNETERRRAKKKAVEQGMAAHASGYNG